MTCYSELTLSYCRIKDAISRVEKVFEKLFHTVFITVSWDDKQRKEKTKEAMLSCRSSFIPFFIVSVQTLNIFLWLFIRLLESYISSTSVCTDGVIGGTLFKDGVSIEEQNIHVLP